MDRDKEGWEVKERKNCRMNAHALSVFTASSRKKCSVKKKAESLYNVF